MSVRLLLTAAVASFSMTALLVWLRRNYDPVLVMVASENRVRARAFLGSIVTTSTVGVAFALAAAIQAV